MTADDEPRQEEPLTEAERARRRARVFGEVLPETTGDERSTSEGAEGAEGGAGGDDEWLRANVPPHHGT